MSNKTLPLFLAVAFAIAPMSLSVVHAKDAHHHHHDHGVNALQLNDGSQWETDAPLRKAMAVLRSEIQPLLPVIHEDELAADRYESLATTVNDQVTYMIENCGLEGEADAQLHLVIADLMAAASIMQGDEDSRRDGAVRAVGALNNYATYFDDPAFEKLGH